MNEKKKLILKDEDRSIYQLYYLNWLVIQLIKNFFFLYPPSSFEMQLNCIISLIRIHTSFILLVHSFRDYTIFFFRFHLSRLVFFQFFFLFAFYLQKWDIFISLCLCNKRTDSNSLDYFPGFFFYWEYNHWIYRKRASCYVMLLRLTIIDLFYCMRL